MSFARLIGFIACVATQALVSVSFGQDLSSLEFASLGAGTVVRFDQSFVISYDWSQDRALPIGKTITSLDTRNKKGIGETAETTCNLLLTDYQPGPYTISAGRRVVISAERFYHRKGEGLTLHFSDQMNIGLRCQTKYTRYQISNAYCLGRRWENCWKGSSYLDSRVDIRKATLSAAMAALNGAVSLENVNFGTAL